MRYAIIIATLLLGGCNEFTCINGQVYRRLDGDTWIRSGQWAHSECTMIQEKK